MTQPEALTLFVNSSMELMQLLIFREDLAADPDITPAELAESLKACDEQIERYVRGQVQQVDGIAQFMHECDVRRDTLKEEAKALTGRAAIWEARRQRAEEMVMRVMQSDKATRLEGTAHSFAIKKNPPSADIAQPALVPATYKRIAVTMGPALFDSLCNFLVRYEQGATLLAELMQCKRTEPEVSRSKVLTELKAEGSVPGARLVTDKVRLEVK